MKIRTRKRPADDTQPARIVAVDLHSAASLVRPYDFTSDNPHEDVAQALAEGRPVRAVETHGDGYTFTTDQ